MTKRIPIPINIHSQDIPFILKSFFDLAETSKFPKKHRYYSACAFYNKLIEGKCSVHSITQQVKYILNEICHILIMADQLYKTNKRKELSRCGKIVTLAAEAQIGSYYKRLGFSVKWLSPTNEDPPDLVVCNPHDKLKVDIEVKIKDETFKTKNLDGAIKAIFASLSKSLASLHNRKHKKNPAIVAVHADKDLNWPDWLVNPEISKRLESRLILDEYKIISGIIFSGGSDILHIGQGINEYSTKLVAFRSHVAYVQLPRGFLPTLTGEL